ncbi:MAG: hypothetical protein VX632_05820, partial [Chloroflexota bacterium]|nr:hypothetical protein [Chloroflexota bacterium]
CQSRRLDRCHSYGIEGIAGEKHRLTAKLGQVIMKVAVLETWQSSFVVTAKTWIHGLAKQRIER